MEKEMATHSSILARRIPRTEEPVSYSPWDREESDTTEQLYTHTEKTTRPFRYDLNQTSYDYTIEVTNRFKEIDLIDRVPDELWTEVCDIVQETEIKTIPK